MTTASGTRGKRAGGRHLKSPLAVHADYAPPATLPATLAACVPTTCGSLTPPRSGAAAPARPSGAATSRTGPGTATAPVSPGTSGGSGCFSCAPLHGLPVMFAIAGAKADERETLLAMLEIDATTRLARTSSDPSSPMTTDSNHTTRNQLSKEARFGLGVLGAEGVGDALVGGVSLCVDAVRVDLEQHGEAVPCTAGDLGGGHPRVEPQRHRRMPQVIRAAAERGAVLRLSKGPLAGLGPDGAVGGVLDDPSPGGLEDPPTEGWCRTT
jgi:hypothetical protein